MDMNNGRRKCSEKFTRKRSRVEFSVRDTVIRKNAIHEKIAALVNEAYEPEIITRLNSETVKQTSFITSSYSFITIYLKNLIHKEGPKRSIIGKKYISYTPVKLLKLIDEIQIEIFGRRFDLDKITPEQILVAEEYFNNLEETKKVKLL